MNRATAATVAIYGLALAFWIAFWYGLGALIYAWLFMRGGT